MAQSADDARPAWVSERLYPFESRFFTTPGGRMHYVDEGAGAPIVFLHGNPSWSFEFRGLVADLRDRFRCVAPDHLGFGLSARPGRGEEHHPAAHAENFIALMHHLGLDEVTLFLADWGGPIGLEFARRHPERVARLVIVNTWAWPVDNDLHFVAFSRLMGGALGRFLITRRNLFVNRVMPAAVGDRSCLTAEVMDHYRQALPTPAARAACAALPGTSSPRRTGCGRSGTSARNSPPSRRCCCGATGISRFAERSWIHGGRPCTRTNCMSFLTAVTSLRRKLPAR